MTKFKFSDGEDLDFNQSKRTPNNQKTIEFGMEGHITNTIKNYLFYSLNRLSTIDLPSNIEVKYVNESRVVQGLIKLAEKTEWLVNIKKIGNIDIKEDKYPENYIYPASMSPSKAILYISKDFNKESKKISKKIKGIEKNDIVRFRSYFDGNNEKALEYAFGHELGHFFILSKNYNNPELEKNKIIQRISTNIEEAFAEAFSIQLMCLKDSTIDINSIKNGRFLDSKLKLDDILITSNATQRSDYVNTYGIEKLIDTYNFKTLYDNLPIKDSNGNIESNIDKIYDGCLRIAKENNKEVIQDILNNETYKKEGLATVFKNDLRDSIKDVNGVLNNDDLIDKIHKKISGTSFNTSKMKMLREKFLNNQNDSKYKPK